MANCVSGECEGDPKYTNPIAVNPYPGGGDGGGHEFVTELPEKGVEGVEYVVLDDISDCDTYKGTYVWNKECGGFIETSGSGGGVIPRYTFQNTETGWRALLGGKVVFEHTDKGGGGTGGGSLTKEITVSNPVGRWTNGTKIPVGTPLEDIIKGMLEKVSYPTLTNPSVTLTYNGPILKEIGETISGEVASLTFSRGSITPAYGTSGFRSGVANKYEFLINGVATTTPGTTYTIPDMTSDTTIQAKVSYDPGDQPKDSDGKNYQTALPAGSVLSATKKVEFVYPVWSNAVVNTVIDKMPLISKSTQYVNLNFVNALAAYPETVDIPTTWTVSAVEVYDAVSKSWKATCDFATTTATHNDAAGRPVAYTRYYDKRGFNQGAREVRLKVKQP